MRPINAYVAADAVIMKTTYITKYRYVPSKSNDKQNVVIEMIVDTYQSHRENGVLRESKGRGSFLYDKAQNAKMY
ncbi:hypothetical protein AGMMS49936_08710 [Endomicrobiia bacterium]|nr:hypothetical protein AGMMS49936_08710 [Endomicrobiia bacterium]